jgi:hypothetical protein
MSGWSSKSRVDRHGKLKVRATIEEFYGLWITADFAKVGYRSSFQFLRLYRADFCIFAEADSEGDLKLLL